jgi:hypothetical protein
MGGSWAVNDDRKPARIGSKNPSAVKKAEFNTEPAGFKNFVIDSGKRRC